MLRQPGEVLGCGLEQLQGRQLWVDQHIPRFVGQALSPLRVGTLGSFGTGQHRGFSVQSSLFYVPQCSQHFKQPGSQAAGSSRYTAGGTGACNGNFQLRSTSTPSTPRVSPKQKQIDGKKTTSTSRLKLERDLIHSPSCSRPHLRLRSSRTWDCQGRLGPYRHQRFMRRFEDAAAESTAP